MAIPSSRLAPETLASNLSATGLSVTDNLLFDDATEISANETETEVSHEQLVSFDAVAASVLTKGITDVILVTTSIESKDWKLELFGEMMGLWGTIMAIIMYSSSFPVLRVIIREKSTCQYSFVPYLGMWVNTAAFVNYCVHRGGMLSCFIANGLGLALSSFSLLVFGMYANPEVRRQFVLSVGSTGLLGVALVSYSHCSGMDCSVASWGKCWWGAVAFTANIVMFIGPCLIFAHVWRTKSVQFLPLSVAFSTFFCSVPWLLYGLCYGDLTIIVPNIIGICLSLLQMIVYKYVSTFFPQGDVEEKFETDLKDGPHPQDPHPLPQSCSSFGALPSKSSEQ
jgi:hypothetical protein